LIGLFVNLLVLRGRVSGGASFRQLLAAARVAALGAYAHQDLPFEKLIEELKVERSLRHSPLFQVMFALQNAPMDSLDLPGLSLSAVDSPIAASKFDLSLLLAEVSGALVGTLEYCTDLFDAVTVQRMMRHLEVFLEGAVADPERQVSELPLLTAAERQELHDWNDRRPEAGAFGDVHVLVGHQAARGPEAVAVTFAGEEVTYRELERRSGRLASRLVSLGVGADVLVGLCAERSPEMLVGVLAVLRAGGAYVPLDPSYPRERLAMILEDARPGVLLTQERLLPELPGSVALTVCLDDPSLAGEVEAAPAAVAAESLAYVLFTSGSTGRPKGVQISRGALLNFLRSVEREPGLAAGDVLLAVTTLAFDIAALERMLLDAGWQGNRGLRALCGGEALPTELAARLLPRVGSLWNLYGPTETTVWSAVGGVK